MNVFLRIGNWLDRKPLRDQITDVAVRVGALEQFGPKLAATEKELKELKEYVAKMAMYTSFAAPKAGTPESLRSAIEAFGRVG